MEKITISAIEKQLQNIFKKERSGFTCIITGTFDSVKNLIDKFDLNIRQNVTSF